MSFAPFEPSLLPAELAALVSAHVVSAVEETVAMQVFVGYLDNDPFHGYDVATRGVYARAASALSRHGFRFEDAVCGGFASDVWETWLFRRAA